MTPCRARQFILDSPIEGRSCVNPFLHKTCKCELCSRGYGESSDDESEENRGEDTRAMHSAGNPKPAGSSGWKKPIEVDVEGQPWGPMKDSLQKDIQKYAKELDPSSGWEGQPQKLRRNLYKRLYAGEYCPYSRHSNLCFPHFVHVFKAIADECVTRVDWEISGDNTKVSDKYIQPIITKTLITARYRINQLIDGDHRRPDDVPLAYWKKMVEIRSTDTAKQKSAHMRAISQSKVSTSKKLKAIEREVVSRLVSIQAGLMFRHPHVLMSFLCP